MCRFWVNVTIGTRDAETLSGPEKRGKRPRLGYCSFRSKEVDDEAAELARLFHVHDATDSAEHDATRVGDAGFNGFGLNGQSRDRRRLPSGRRSLLPGAVTRALEHAEV